MFNPARFFIVSLIAYCLLLITPSAYAEGDPYLSPNISSDVPKNLHYGAQSTLIEVLSAVTCQLTGIDPTNPNQQCLGVDSQTGKIGFVKNGSGAIGMMTNMIAIMYTPPLHFSDYTRYLAGNFGIAKPAYAATGFDSISPLLKLWTRFRDIVYLAFILVFVLIGVGIMLRIKIDPRTVMTIENQIPKIIVSLVLVTFSFAIAGLLIDLMWVSTYTAINVLGESLPSQRNTAYQQLTTPPPGFVNEFYKNEKFGGIIKIAGDSSGSIKDIIINLVGETVKPTQKTIVWPVFSGIGDFFSGDWAKNILANFLGWLGAILAFLIIAIALMWALLRLWFQLLSAYVFILLDVVIGPFLIVAGVLPGSPAGIGMWLRDIVAHLSAFPVTIGMFMLGKIFMESFGTAAPNSGVFTPPLIGNPSGDGNLGALGTLLGLAIILITPQVVTMMRDLLKSPQFKYTAAIGQAFGVGGGSLGRIGGGITGSMFGMHYEDRGGVTQMVARGGPIGNTLRRLGLVK